MYYDQKLSAQNDVAIACNITQKIVKNISGDDILSAIRFTGTSTYRPSMLVRLSPTPIIFVHEG